MRLRWVGDGTGRLTLSDLWALAHSLLADEGSALFRSVHPDHIPHDQRVAADTLNAVMYVAYVAANQWSDKKPKPFQPLRSYPGSPFDKTHKKQPLLDPAARLGGYRSMSLEQAQAWAAARGLPV